MQLTPTKLLPFLDSSENIDRRKLAETLWAELRVTWPETLSSPVQVTPVGRAGLLVAAVVYFPRFSAISSSDSRTPSSSEAAPVSIKEKA